MTIDIEFKCKSATVSGSKWDVVNVEIDSVDVHELLEAIGDKRVFESIDLDDYIDSAESAGHTDDILDRLDADEVIEWLRGKGHLEAES
ncbi:hypothetical protein KX927_05340 [Escherichia coli]|uniref:hypothetical protein n=1 Tax=Escherichia coli TaxID=562 RepID=UPI0019348020|nr:hypothetical protein [Escherichia coli]MBL7388976.1 hypothetical protein [Escherichia coli]UWH33441.1 hypothetical protein KYX58_04705 [Escherichia coli]UWH38104.1 hypothetical protein KX927_05340 [Escherichia coli]